MLTVMRYSSGRYISALVAVVLTLAPLWSSHADVSSKKITLEELLQRKTIDVRDLRALKLDVRPGHGPVLWAPLDDTRVVWFWCRPGISSALGFGEIVLIAIGVANDENHGTIIWPQSKVGRDYGQELESLYKDN